LALLRARQVEPAGLCELAPFAQAVAVAVAIVVVPLCQAIVDLIDPATPRSIGLRRRPRAGRAAHAPNSVAGSVGPTRNASDGLGAS